MNGGEILIRCYGNELSVSYDEINSSVLELKHLIASNCGTPADRQRLLYNGRLLDDDQTLESYGLRDGNTVLMFARASSIASTDPNSAPRVAVVQERQAEGGVSRLVAAIPPPLQQRNNEPTGPRLQNVASEAHAPNFYNDEVASGVLVPVVNQLTSPSTCGAGTHEIVSDLYQVTDRVQANSFPKPNPAEMLPDNDQNPAVSSFAYINRNQILAQTEVTLRRFTKFIGERCLPPYKWQELLDRELGQPEGETESVIVDMNDMMYCLFFSPQLTNQQLVFTEVMDIVQLFLEWFSISQEMLRQKVMYVVTYHGSWCSKCRRRQSARFLSLGDGFAQRRRQLKYLYHIGFVDDFVNNEALDATSGDFNAAAQQLYANLIMSSLAEQS